MLKALGFKKQAEHSVQHQTREESKDALGVYPRKTTTYHKGDTSKTKKEIIRQISNQVTISPDKDAHIKRD
ncbi:MAG: hypothetical protein H8E12_16780 [Rhodobacteraceae bacterium]|nr:hypothetical protein [Paracoccaceae bacterium]